MYDYTLKTKCLYNVHSNKITSYHLWSPKTSLIMWRSFAKRGAFTLIQFKVMLFKDLWNQWKVNPKNPSIFYIIFFQKLIEPIFELKFRKSNTMLFHGIYQWKQKSLHPFSNILLLEVLKTAKKGFTENW